MQTWHCLNLRCLKNSNWTKTIYSTMFAQCCLRCCWRKHCCAMYTYCTPMCRWCCCHNIRRHSDMTLMNYMYYSCMCVSPSSHTLYLQTTTTYQMYNYCNLYNLAHMCTMSLSHQNMELSLFLTYAYTLLDNLYMIKPYYHHNMSQT